MFGEKVIMSQKANSVFILNGAWLGFAISNIRRKDSSL